MAFSKAKINRYYDEVSCAPPPGKYDPKFESKVKAVVFDKGLRFSTPKMERTSSMESLDSCCSSTKTPIFRTPSKLALRKGATTPRTLGSKIPLPDKFHPRQILDNDQRLIDEINELTRVHQSQLLEKNEEIAALIEQINTLNEKIFCCLQVTQVTSKTKSEYETEINNLKKELIDLQMDISSKNENYKNHIDLLKSHISNLEENISNHISINKDLENSLSENAIIYEEINSKISQMADNFSAQLENYVESLKKVEDMNKWLFDDYQCCLEIIKNESEDNVKLKQTLIELQENINICKDDLANALKRCKMYEVVQTETSKTINILSKRLMESEIEVDQLNDVQQDLIQKKNKLEEQVKGLTEENEAIKDSIDSLQIRVSLDVEAMRNQLLDKIESYKKLASEEADKQKLCIEEKQKTIEMLLNEIDFYKTKKSESDIQLSTCQAQIAGYQEEIASLKTALEDLEQDFEEKIGAQKALFSQLSNEYEILQTLSLKEKDQLKKEVLQLKEDKSSLESDLERMNHKISSNHSKIDKLSTHLEEKNNIIKDFEELKIKMENEKVGLLEALSQQTEEYNLLEKKYEIESLTSTELKKDMKIVESNHQKYTDEIISELVLEKERVKELTCIVAKLELEKRDLMNEVNRLNITLSDSRERNNKDVREENEILQKKLVEQLEIIQLFEYERLAHAHSSEEFHEQKDELLQLIGRQNREIEALSETADKHYAARKELEQEICRLNEEKELLKDAGKEDSMKVTSLEATVADLECRIRELTDIIGPFKDQLVQFEQERNYLLNKSENTEKELRALALEHAKSLGHQNQKQKIKHIVNLNQNIANLKKDIEKYRLENIKLKHELNAKKPSTLATNTQGNKENKARIQQKERNTSPSTALKDRNL